MSRRSTSCLRIKQAAARIELTCCTIVAAGRSDHVEVTTTSRFAKHRVKIFELEWSSIDACLDPPRINVIFHAKGRDHSHSRIRLHPVEFRCQSVLRWRLTYSQTGNRHK